MYLSVPDQARPLPRCLFCSADGYIGPANGTVTSPECRGLDPEVKSRDASEPAKKENKIGLGLSRPAPLELGRSGESRWS